MVVKKSTPISDQESPALSNSMLCNAIHSNPDFLQVEHLDKLSQAQGTSKTTYHNYLTLLCMTAFQLDLKRPKHSTHHTEVNNTNSTSSNNKIKSLAVVAKAIFEILVIVVMAMITNLTTIQISLPTGLWESLPASATSTVSQHNHQYNVNTAQQCRLYTQSPLGSIAPTHEKHYI